MTTVAAPAVVLGNSGKIWEAPTLLPCLAAAAVALACPEIGWLAQCLSQAPMPEGWRRLTEEEHQELGFVAWYANVETAEVSNEPPMLQEFCRLAKYALHARTDASSLDAASAWVRRMRDEALAEVKGASKGWTGPHFDPASGS